MQRFKLNHVISSKEKNNKVRHMHMKDK